MTKMSNVKCSSEVDPIHFFHFFGDFESLITTALGCTARWEIQTTKAPIIYDVIHPGSSWNHPICMNKINFKRIKTFFKLSHILKKSARVFNGKSQT